VPLAAVGIISLGLVPALGGPGLPLHWAMTLGMTGFGGLLAFRHVLQRGEGPLPQVPFAQARYAGRAVLWISIICTLLVLGIIGRQLWLRGPIAPLSLAMPLAGLAWIYSVALRSLRWPADRLEPQPNPDDRPSHRPPSWEQRLTPPGSSAPGGSGRHASA
jgi:hypothetical protein